MLSRENLIKHSDTHYSLDKYQLYRDEDGKWEVHYKDHGIQYIDDTLGDAVDSILAGENYDGGPPE
jgi:hypothetical protein